MARPKLDDVARVAGVSPTTVSRVLNDRGYLSQATKDKVRAAVAEIGYRPNAIARSLQGSKSATVGIIFPSVAHPFYGQMAAALETRLANAGYRVLLCDSDDNPRQERRHLDMLLAHQVDGIITGAHSDVVAETPALPSALVTIDRPAPGRFPNVRCDNRGIAREAVRGLLARGAERPVHLTSSANPQSQRLLGYLDAMAEADRAPRIVRVERRPRWAEDDAAVAAGLDGIGAEGSAPPDAVAATNDVLASSAIRWARSRGMDVPRDVQVVGFDGADTTRALLPELSTVVQPYELLADRAVARLLHAIEGGAAPHGSDEIPARIHWGATTR